MKKYTVLALMAAICWVPAMAQNALPSRTLTIEGSFNPQATQAGKIMPVPDKPQLNRKETKVSYLTQSMPNITHQRQPMTVFGYNSDNVIVPRFQGLARLGYGLRNLHDGVLDFDWNISDRDILNVSGQMDGWSSKPDGNWKSRMFNGGARLGYVHKFNSFDIGINGGYSHSHFNFRQGALMDSAKLAKSNLMQKVNRADVGLVAKGNIGDVKWNVGVKELWYFHNGLIINDVAGNDKKENQFRFDAGLSFPMMNGTAGMDVSFRNFSYDWTAGNGKKYVDNSSLSISPYWCGNLDDMDICLGLNLNLHTKIGHKFLASPMATLRYHASEKFNFLTSLTGGLIENDMRALESISPYFSNEEQITDGYTLINMSVGGEYESGTWLGITGSFGYKRNIDELFQVSQNGMLVTSALKQQSSNIFYLNLNADMLFTDRAQLSFDFTYNNYMGKYPGRKMELKPAVDIALYSRVNIARNFDGMLTYRLMAFNWIEGVAAPTVNDLALTFDYDLKDNISLYATFNKLLGGDFYYFAGYRALKPAFLLGATYRF